MSRVIVKGLPTYYTEDKLREHFEKKGTVTDVKLKRKNNGESRRFAFIGYRDVQDAESAVKFFNNSFIDTSRITVELAKSFIDPNVPISWKEKRKQRDELLARTEIRLKEMEDAADRRKSKKQKTQKSSLLDKIENDPTLKEFVETMKPATQSRSWANDELVNVEGAPTNENLEAALGLKQSSKSNAPVMSHSGNTSDEEYEDFNPNSVSNDHEEEEVSADVPDLQTHVAQDETSTEVVAETIEDDVDDLDWLKSKRKRLRDTKEGEESTDVITKEHVQSAENNIDENDAEDEKHEDFPQKELSLEERNIDKIMVTGRLFLRNILYSSTEEDFEKLFAPFGELIEVHIAVDTNGKSKGFAYIHFKNPKDAVKAYIELDKQIFQGRLLHILPGDAKKEHKLDEFELKNMPLKKQRLLKKKHEAAKLDFSWNSLYMNSDAVLESVASQLGISKNELIDPTNSSSGVKQALAEAHVIGDVRSYFESRGVDLTKFNQKERDDRVILVKNFQYGTTKEEIGELFAAYGELNRILMPPAGTIAIIEFRDPQPARIAFNKLSFRRLGKSIIYLEKGPKDLFNKPADENDRFQVVEKIVEISDKANSIVDAEENSSDNDEPVGPTVSIFIKNLNFKTENAKLSELFRPYPGFLLSIIKTKPDPKNPGKLQSMGFGFAEFKTKDQANAALKALNGSVLDGHRLLLKISNRVGTKDESTSARRKVKSGKIIVKNLPFEATRKDVLELFNSFGSLKSVRVPKKFDKSARGFAFVEFATNKEAVSAMDQLQGVHLLGRRLVLDFAEKESDDIEAEIEKMTKKTKTQARVRELAEIREGNSGKRKVDMEDEEEDF
ncbi:hypothetical protein CANINC_004024 [Pichia inconspicua]|uniref:Multiple RNA-binding domain-containing protein 1 n=1 Tax=Pichia inconspicua TaxID=52247 RepID=A0A4T0WX44_9ASCO|nr:hypothetical protein CANINC_004024 [[Candida] inconspicua]